jgi:predicted nucleotidyltransferase
MKISSDYRDLLRGLNAAGVRYLVVGGYAVMIYTEPRRWTKDLGLWVEPAEANARRLVTALAEFGTPLRDIGWADFTAPEVFYQIGIEPVRVDILTSVTGLEFGSAWRRRKVVDFDGEPVPVVSREDLLASKEAAGRRRDRGHARGLRKPPKRRP